MHLDGKNNNNSNKTMDRSSKFVLRKIIVDFVCLFVVGMTVLMFYLFGKPYERGFFCNDESLSHPFHESTVTSLMLYFIGLFLPICTMVVLEYNRSKSLANPKSFVFFGHTIPPWVSMAYNKIGVFGFGAASTVLATDVAKYTVGRLRPHFLTLCVPNVDCSDESNRHRYIEDFQCTASGVSAKLLKELRLSFPSGHSSFSAYTMVYLALYLQLRFTWKGSKLLRHLLQLLCIIMAWFTAMTRISNYKHHWSDVLAGSAIGTTIALVMALGVADLFKERRQTMATTSRSSCANCQAELSDDKVRAVDYEIAASSDNATAHQLESMPLRISSSNYGGVMTELKNSASISTVKRSRNL